MKIYVVGGEAEQSGVFGAFTIPSEKALML